MHLLVTVMPLGEWSTNNSEALEAASELIELIKTYPNTAKKLKLELESTESLITNKLTPLEITLLEGIYGHKSIFAECRLRAQMAIRKAERGASPLLGRAPVRIEPNPADRH